MDMVVNRLGALSRPQGAQFAEELHHLIRDLFTVEGRGGVTKTAGNFTLAGVVEVFGLKYTAASSGVPEIP
jgi:hypothetical protein